MLRRGKNGPELTFGGELQRAARDMGVVALAAMTVVTGAAVAAGLETASAVQSRGGVKQALRHERIGRHVRVLSLRLGGDTGMDVAQQLARPGLPGQEVAALANDISAQANDGRGIKPGAVVAVPPDLLPADPSEYGNVADTAVIVYNLRGGATAELIGQDGTPTVIASASSQ